MGAFLDALSDLGGVLAGALSSLAMRSARSVKPPQALAFEMPAVTL